MKKTTFTALLFAAPESGGRFTSILDIFGAGYCCCCCNISS